MSQPEFTINFDEMYGPLYQCPAVNCYEVMRTKDQQPKCPHCGAFMEPIRPFENKGKKMKKLGLVLVCFFALASYSQAGILFHRNGCDGGQASAGCQGKQGGCASVQAQGCQSSQASCYGGHGGLLGRFHPLDRLRHRRGVTVVIPSESIAPPQVKPMPAKMTDVPTLHTSLAFGTVEAAADALAEVNAARAKRGMRPFQRDEGLTIGAQKCAEYRAKHRMAGHTRNDFQFLPAGSTASAGGCAALEPSWGWGSCCTFENWSTAGAAIVPGNDGRRYMQLFVR